MNGPVKRNATAQDLLEAWRREPIDGSARGSADPQRQIQQVAAALRGVEARRRLRARWLRIASGLAVAAALAGVFVGAWTLGRGQLGADRAAAGAGSVRVAFAEGALRMTSATGAALAQSAELSEGTRLETGDGRAELVFASGARTQLSREARLSISEASSGHETLRLERGRVDVDVPKGVAALVFSVRTADAVVVVHGTRFSVEASSSRAGGRTRVTVTRGVVAVLADGKEVRLSAGQEWPPQAAVTERADAPDASAAQGAAPREESAAPTLEPHEQPRKPKAKRSKQRRTPRASLRAKTEGDSDLPEENRAFAAAMARKKSGELAGALGDVEAFIASYPDSVLMQEAEVERFRLLHRLGRTRDAARRARQYLGDYRDGFAREEARDIALEQP